MDNEEDKNVFSGKWCRKHRIKDPNRPKRVYCKMARKNYCKRRIWEVYISVKWCGKTF